MPTGAELNFARLSGLEFFYSVLDARAFVRYGAIMALGSDLGALHRPRCDRHRRPSLWPERAPSPDRAGARRRLRRAGAGGPFHTQADARRLSPWGSGSASRRRAGPRSSTTVSSTWASDGMSSAPRSTSAATPKA